MKNLRFWTFLGLLLFCGQTLAASFLNCCAGMAEMENDFDHASNEMQHDFHNDLSLVETDEPNSMSMRMSDHKQECDHQCDFCIVAPIALEDFNKPHKLFRSAYKFFYDLILSANTTESPFRPPIFA
jgi:hypothetical protein